MRRRGYKARRRLVPLEAVRVEHVQAEIGRAFDERALDSSFLAYAKRGTAVVEFFS